MAISRLKPNGAKLKRRKAKSTSMLSSCTNLVATLSNGASTVDVAWRKREEERECVCARERKKKREKERK